MTSTGGDGLRFGVGHRLPAVFRPQQPFRLGEEVEEDVGGDAEEVGLAACSVSR